MGSIWVSVCVLLSGSSLSEHTHTRTQSSLKKTNQAEEAGGQLSESLKSEPVSKKSNETHTEV